MSVVQIDNGIVVAAWHDVRNVQEWSQKYSGEYPEGLTLVDAPESATVGSTFQNGVFIPPVIEVSENMVITERDRRVEKGTSLPVTGIGLIPISGRQSVQMDLQGLTTAAQVAKSMGNNDPQFPFRDEERHVHMLTPDQVIELYMGGVQWITRVRSAAWNLIDTNPTPQDYQEDKYWP